MATDMSLGGGAGFGAGYTPIRFAPLVSLTGPVMAQAPAAPTAEAPMAPALRLPTMADMPDNAYMTGEIPAYGGASIGNRSGAEIRGDLARIGEFFMSPLGTMASYAATGKMPSENFQGLMGGANPFAGFLQGLQGLFNGGQQAAEVPLGGSSAGGLASQGQGMGFAAFNDAMNAAMSGGASAEMADAAGRAALGLVAQGMDPASAVALASMTALGQVGPDMAAGMGGVPTAPAGMPGLSRNPFDQMTPVAPQTAQTFALGQPGQIESSTQMGGMGGAESPFGGFTGGGWSAGDVAGAYSDSTGFE